MNKLHIILLMIFLIPVLETISLPLRSITTMEWDHYSYGDEGFRVEEVGLYRLNDKLSLVAKAESDERPYRRSIKGMGGVVFGLFSYSYMETSYGVSVVDGETLIHHLLAEYYYEREKYYFIFGTKAQLNEDQSTLIPSAAAKWHLLPAFSL